MKTRKLTKYLLASTAVVWIVWDIFVAIEPTPGDTESEVIRDYAWNHPFVPLGFGVLMGHFLWTRAGGRYFKRSPWLLVPIGLGALALDASGVIGSIQPLIPFGAGMLLGHTLWTQSTPDKHKEAT